MRVPRLKARNARLGPKTRAFAQAQHEGCSGLLPIYMFSTQDHSFQAVQPDAMLLPGSNSLVGV
jgi:hypothetical protein